MRALVPDLGKEVTRWSGQVMDTFDYCGFIGRNPGNDNVYVATGDSGQGMTHGALAGILLADLILKGSSPWEPVYDPARKTFAGLSNLLSENMTAIKSFAEYLLPGDLTSIEELKPGQGGVIRDGLSKIAACRDLDGKLHLAFGRVHPSRMPASLELHRAVLGLSVSRVAFRPGWRSAQRSGHRAAEACEALGEVGIALGPPRLFRKTNPAVEQARYKAVSISRACQRGSVPNGNLDHVSEKKQRKAKGRSQAAT